MNLALRQQRWYSRADVRAKIESAVNAREAADALWIASSHRDLERVDHANGLTVDGVDAIIEREARIHYQRVAQRPAPACLTIGWLFSHHDNGAIPCES